MGAFAGALGIKPERSGDDTGPGFRQGRLDYVATAFAGLSLFQFPFERCDVAFGYARDDFGVRRYDHVVEIERPTGQQLGLVALDRVDGLL